MRSLVISIFLYACESGTLTAELERRIQAMEMRCFRKLLGITYMDRISNEEVQNRVKQTIGPYDDLLTTVRHRKLKWYRHLTSSSGLSKTILQGTSTRRKEERQTEEDMGGQHKGVDRTTAERYLEEGGES